MLNGTRSTYESGYHLLNDTHCHGTRENARLSALEAYEILDTPRENDFDEIARLAADICGTPIAVVNLIANDRQFFKAEVGLGVRETPFESSFCAKAILEQDFLLVPDATKDHRFDCNPLVTGEPHLRFYAGAILKTPDNFPIGTVCVLDYQARELSDLQQRTLRVLATQVMAQLELRRTARAERLARHEAEADRTRYKAVFESAIDYAIVVMDRDGTITDWNEGARRILGWETEEIIGSDVSRFFTPEDREAGVPAREMEGARSTGRGIDERWHVRKGGERFWANGEMMRLEDAGGALEGYVKILRDRTHERLAKEALEASERRWRELFEAMSEGFFLADVIRDDNGRPADYRIVEANPAFAVQAGLPLSSVGRSLRSFSTQTPAWLFDRFSEAVDSDIPQAFELHVPALDRWLEIRSKKHGDDQLSCLFYDVTARKLSEDELARSEERLTMALNASGGVGLWDWMLDTDLLHGDAVFAAMYGLDEAKVEAGVTMEEYQTHVVPEDIWPLREKLRAVFEEGAGFDVEYRIDVPGQGRKWVECKGKIIEATENHPKRFSGTAVDITKLKAAESQKQLLMEELAHRVKNTFSVVQAIAAQTLRRADPEVSKTFTERVLALSRAHDILLQTNWASTGIVSLMENVLAMQAETGRFEITGPDIVLGSKTALSMSLLMHEMATNAVKYGALSVEVGKVLIGWEVVDGVFTLTWMEVNGPAAKAPARRGFGSRLIQMGINGSGLADLDYGSTGLRATFSAPSALLGQ